MRIALIGTVASSIIGFRRELVKSLLDQGHEVYALAVDYTAETKEQVASLGAIPVAYRFNRAGMNPLRDLFDTLLLAKTLRCLAPDLVFSYFSKPVIFGTIAAALAGVKRRVAMLEGLGFIFTDQPEGIDLKMRFLRQVQVFLYRISFPFLERIIFLNPDDPIDLVGGYRLNVPKVDVLGGIGVDFKTYFYVKPQFEKVTFLFIGRLLKEKGINEFIDAARIVKRQYTDVSFTILGGLDIENPGGIKADVLRSLTESGLIDYPGHVVDIPARIASASVFVLPSYYREGVPRSTQEAMAIGRPIITTNVAGCRETVVDGINGFLIPPWDPQTLAEKMIYFIQNPARMEIMGLESYRMAREKFDAIQVNKRLMALLGL